MRVLIACEFSGVVRDAFTARGHDAWSCDLLPSETAGNHIQGDCLAALGLGWDLMLAHPPCTYLCNSGVSWLSRGGKINEERHKLMMAGCDLFAAFYNSNIPKIAVENPVMHKYARDYLQSVWRVPRFTCSIQPWQHGHGEVKRTCLWLRGLPDLKPSNVVAGRAQRSHFESPGPQRWKNRSRTLAGIACAMAEQWG